MTRNSGVIIIDRGWQRFYDEIKDLDKKVIDAGIQSGTNSKILDYAFWNEFGTTKIPERPFLRSTLVTFEKELLQKSKEALQKICQGSSVIQQLQILGMFFESKIKQNILDDNFVENAEYTKKKKGSSLPLVDTAQMMNQIRYVVRDRT